jgi:hypothetical protein
MALKLNQPKVDSRPYGTNRQNWSNEDFNRDNTKLFWGQTSSSGFKILEGQLLFIPGVLADQPPWVTNGQHLIVH